MATNLRLKLVTSPLPISNSPPSQIIYIVGSLIQYNQSLGAYNLKEDKCIRKENTIRQPVVSV